MSNRQRHVFPNREIPHLWAHQTQDEARNGTGSFYFRGLGPFLITRKHHVMLSLARS